MDLKKIHRGDPVQIIWIDAHFQADRGWIPEKDMIDDTEGCTIKSICHFLCYDDEYVYTAADRSVESGHEKGIMRDLKIPIGCLKKIRRLK